MKLSRFNVIKKEADSIYIYNTLTSSVLRLNNEYSKQFYKALDNGDFNNIEADLKDNLIEGQMVVEDDLSELDYIIMLHNISRFSNNSINYTIAPTMKCNFRCTYCYEKGRNYGTMDKNVISNVKSLITSNANNHSYLHITWYGGEPLVAFDIIEELSHTAKIAFGDKYMASMVTNGYLLTEDVAMKLSSLNIKTLQVTIDGPPDIHNKRRCLPDKSDTFFVILSNIKNAIRINSKLNITVRVNIDKDNIARIDEMDGLR
ncbi:MAG: radical SAM protein [Bacilli bacterium]